MPCELLFDRQPENYLWEISKFKIGQYDAKNDFLSALIYETEGVKLGRPANCNDCEFQMKDSYHVAQRFDPTRCMAVDQDNNKDVGAYIEAKDIFVSSTMDGLFSENCIDKETFERFKKKEIDQIYEIGKTHPFKHSPASWISKLGDQQVIQGFKLNRLHSIVLK